MATATPLYNEALRWRAGAQSGLVPRLHRREDAREGGAGELSESFGDSERVYLREIRAIPLLSRAEEAALGRAVIAHGPDSALGHPAYLELVRRNLRLVPGLAPFFRGHGVDWLDLVQAGNLGLMRAARTWDPDDASHAHFSTYATWWVRQHMGRAARQDGAAVHIPEYVQTDLRHLARAEAEVEAALGGGGEVPVGAVAARLGVPAGGVESLRVWRHDYGLGGHGRGAISLDAEAPRGLHTGTHGADNDGKVRDEDLGDYLPDQRASDPEAELVALETREELYRALRRLPGREAVVLVLRWGLDGGTVAHPGPAWHAPLRGSDLGETRHQTIISEEHARSLEEVAVWLGVTRERVRQVEHTGLAHLAQLLGAPPRATYEAEVRARLTPAQVADRRAKDQARWSQKKDQRGRPRAHEGPMVGVAAE